jgi:glutathione S-transferase
MIELFFWPTPNGYKATITLAELGLLDKVTPIDILSGEQFDPADVTPSFPPAGIRAEPFCCA